MNHYILAGGAADSSAFWNSPLGTVLGNILVAVGVIVVIAAIFKSIKNFIDGKIGKGAQSIIGGLIIAAFCFKPELIDGLINLVTDLLGKGTDSVNQISNGTGAGGSGKAS